MFRFTTALQSKLVHREAECKIIAWQSDRIENTGEPDPKTAIVCELTTLVEVDFGVFTSPQPARKNNIKNK